ncbi:MAG: sigma-70 family RNA polymerase sigma factor [Deltaproteobacteria bacterium]|nr:sigma-70 family RNA polymerase sigma factor [Deltaproteobacteria bacterium]
MIGIFLGMVLGPSDAELVARFKEGDRSAYEAIMRRYQDTVYTLALRWMRDEQVAEEVSQDIFIKLHSALHDFRGDATLRTWIYRVAVNHCKNRRLYRSRRKMDQHDPLEGRSPDPDAPARELPSPLPLPDHDVQRAEAEVLLRAALAELDPEQRQIIVLRDVEDLDYQEIADLLQLPRGTVKSRLHRARQQLAQRLSLRVQPEDIA